MTDMDIYYKLWNLRCILRDTESGTIKEVFQKISSARAIVDDLIDCYEVLLDEAEEKKGEGEDSQ